MPDDPDYVVATVLPTLALRATDDTQARKQFTFDEARSLEFRGLPVVINHQANVPGFTVGRVAAATIRNGGVQVLLALDPEARLENLYASNAVAGGLYADVSLTHGWDETVRASSTAPRGYEDVITKDIREISLVREGWRPGSRISQFFPSRRTLARLTPDTLAEFAKRNGHPPPPAAASDVFPVYIEQLHDRIQSRLKEARAPFFAPPSSQAMSSGIVQASNGAAAPMAAAAAAAVPAATSSIAPAGTSVETAPVTGDDLMNKQVLAQKYVQLEGEKAQLAKEMKELLAFKAQHERQEQARRADELTKTRHVIDAYVQWMREKGGKSEAEAAFIADQFRRQAEADPVAARQLIEPQYQLLVQASKDAQEQRSRAEELERRTNDDAERKYFSQLASQANSYRRESASTASAFSSSSTPSLASSSLYSPAPPPSSSSSSSFAKRFPDAVAPTQVVMASNTLAASAPPPTTTTTTTMTMSEPSLSGATWARDVFDRSVKLTGGTRIPSYDEVARGGLTKRKTGRVQAGANGGPSVEETEIAFVGAEPKAFSFAEFAPDVWERFQRAGAKRPKVCASLKAMNASGAFVATYGSAAVHRK